jgi:hypothetical protein
VASARCSSATFARPTGTWTAWTRPWRIRHTSTLSLRTARRCPRHIEHDLRSGYVVQNDLSEAQDAIMPDAPVARLGRKVRKPRHPDIVQPTFSRAMRNNGLIEIINDPDDDTDGEGNYIFGNEEKDVNSQVYRVPEKGIVLDFIDKVKGYVVAPPFHSQKLTFRAVAGSRSRHRRREGSRLLRILLPGANRLCNNLPLARSSSNRLLLISPSSQTRRKISVWMSIVLTLSS